VRLQLWTDHEPGAPRAGAALVCEGLTRAGRHRARHARTALEIATPACGAVLDALRERVGEDVDRIGLRRAGPTVLVDVELRP
jgi:hypothetical protein